MANLTNYWKKNDKENYSLFQFEKMNNTLATFPGRENLLEWFGRQSADIYDVNAHIHSPFSFSAFDDLEQAFRLASGEGVRVLGLNDFNTVEGYALFHELGMKYKIFPLFNIEFMGLLKDEQKKGIRVNDPNNPGRVYFSGKGLDFPVSFGSGSRQKIEVIIEEGHRQVREMTEKMNNLLNSLDSRLSVDFEIIKKNFTLGMVRERHIARAVHLLIDDRFRSPEAKSGFLKRLYNGIDPGADILYPASVENEIRARMLKSGGPAFVEEDPGAFLGLDEIISIILDGGGIPCYPVLLDDKNGWHTEFESDMQTLCSWLRARGIYCIELIPGRNDGTILEKFVLFFRDNGFIVLFGTEHNTPSLDPLRITSRGKVPLDDLLRETAFQGACVIAAHQYLRARGENGFESNGKNGSGEINELARLGRAVIEKYLNY
jgi:hypothetical protein